MAQIKRFGATTGMTYWRFTDHERARASGLPGAIVPGIMSQGILVSLVHRWAPEATVHKIDTIFRAPVLVDSEPVGRGVVDVSPGEGRGVDSGVVGRVVALEVAAGERLGNDTPVCFAPEVEEAAGVAGDEGPGRVEAQRPGARELLDFVGRAGVAGGMVDPALGRNERQDAVEGLGPFETAMVLLVWIFGWPTWWPEGAGAPVPDRAHRLGGDFTAVRAESRAPVARGVEVVWERVGVEPEEGNPAAEAVAEVVGRPVPAVGQDEGGAHAVSATRGRA